MAAVTLLADLGDPGLAAAVADLGEYLRRCGHRLAESPTPGAVAVVFTDRPPSPALVDRMLDAARDGGLLLAGPTLAACRDVPGLTGLLGVCPGAVQPEHEVRLRPGPAGVTLCARLALPLHLTDAWTSVERTGPDVAVQLTAAAGLRSVPALTARPTAGGCVGALVLGSRPETVADPDYRRLVSRWVHLAAAQGPGVEPAPVRVGMLGYGAVGVEHALALAAVPGLEFAGVCDLNPERVAAARRVAAQVRVYPDPQGLLDSPEVDLVLVSTPPNTHAEWARRALERGKSVVVEKPFCLTTAEADDLIALAGAQGRLVVCYQNRRWDRDYLALRAAVRAGAVGTVFDYSSFVGGYQHPCNYWHSDAEVSGGAVYDWGSHFLDWALDLLPQDIASVSASEHKLVWHDVTNADHTTVRVRFVDGVEAEFVHSDLAAAPKPKWHVLGTRGALVGSWRAAALASRDPVGNLVEDRLALAESPAELRLFGADGAVTTLALPPAPEAPFHRELADRLLLGEPMSVTAESSRRCTAVLEAATASIRSGGRPVTPA